jgi:outer membrane receptor for ferrienterochelin and colicins
MFNDLTIKIMKYIFLVGFILLFLPLNAQVRGVVYGSDPTSKNALYGARIELSSGAVQLRTTEDGKFEFVLPKEMPDTLVISAMGFNSDTIYLTKDDRFSNFQIVLYSELLLPEVIASYKKGSKSVSKLKTLLVEEISSDELKKAACCNLSESFETNASVDVSITDAVSGAKQIQMMGLSGVYTQIQMENIPYLRGLESAFGLNSIPGTWVNSIQITKGTGPVVNGYESMAGLINIELLKPESMERLYVNGYGNIFGRAELNVHTGIQVGKKWSTGIFAHGSGIQTVIDQNKDGFKDIPTGYNAALFNRWNYRGNKMEAQFGVNTYIDEKVGGQLNYRPGNEANSLYGVFNHTEHIDAFAKTGFFFKDKPYRSVGILYNAKYQTTEAKFGLRNYSGEEKRGFINIIYDDIIGSTIHKTRMGLSGVVADFQQSQDSLTDNRLEVIPGVFGEYTYTGLRLVNVLGVRYDYHNLYGGIISPRLHSKYILSEKTDLRFTAGRGWRVPNYMIDNLSLLATSRTWIAPTEIKPEVSWNIGGSVVQEFKFANQKASLVLDYYHTYFENQLIVDRDVQQDAIVFSNLANNSFSNSFQAELSISPSKVFDIRFAYKYLDVRAVYDNQLQSKVMVPKHRGFANFAYKSRNKRWMADLTTSVFGQSRLPLDMLPDGGITTNNKSEVFPLISAQLTHVYKKFEFYLGGENLANYTQKNPIIDAQNPFSTTFDATRVWAPVMGTMIYAGFRFTLEKKKEE